MIILAGVNHKSAPIEIRGKFTFNEEDIVNFSKLYKNDVDFQGLIVISTCNRTELYFDYKSENEIEIKKNIVENLKNFANFDGNINDIIYTYSGENVFTHLFKVASGLDSMMLGEYQIVGQIKDAYNTSDKLNLNSKFLMRLFHKALETSKKVRTKTKLNEGAVTVSYAAVEAAYQNFTDLHKRNILSIGAGETGQLVVSNLMKKSCKSITIANRTFEKAAKVAKNFGVSAMELSEVDDRIAEFDVILVSTGSKTPLVTAKKIEKAMQIRKNKPLTLIDLSVPKNIENEAGDIENVKLFDVDGLQGIVNKTYEKRKGKITQAEQIIAVQVEEFKTWLSTTNLVPTFTKVTDKFRKINKLEIEKFQKNKVEIDYTKAVEYGDYITSKYIGMFIKNIKSITDNGKREEYIKVVNELFEMEVSG